MSNKLSGLSHDRAICYSGYREGQSPRDQVYPSYDEIREDLLILKRNWKYLRLYDASPHAETVLEVIRSEKLNFRVMLGMDLAAEVSNPNCPWGGKYDEETLSENRRYNREQMEMLIALASANPDTVFSVSIGNEASVEWTDHLVPTESLVSYAEAVGAKVPQAITFCENYVPWTTKLEPLVSALDFISVHTYPVWEYQTIDNALEYTKRNFRSVTERYPNKPVIITEAGWTTGSNGRGIEPHNVSEEIQAAYYRQLMEWTSAEKILTFVFEAFDEPWKGSPDPMEPEKHWGLFDINRRPKRAMREMFADLI